MTTRTNRKTVTFTNPFVLGGFDETLPAGAYCVETDEQLVEGVSFPVYRRVMTVIHLPARPGHPGLTRTLTIDPNELDAALKRDQAPGEITADPDVDQGMPKGTAGSPRRKADRQGLDRQDLDRAEDEGMIAHPG